MLSIKNLTKIYRLKGGNITRALDGVSLEFPEKGMIFLLGKSGSGKSTLLNLIGGLDSPTDGEIILKGRSSKDFSQADFDSYRNTYIGFVFQEYNILNEFNVEQNIALAIELQNKKVNKADIDSLLEQVDLKDYAKRKPNTLSGGQKQRIAIARALIKSPNIIMADEPTGALDSVTGEQVFETLKKLSKDKLVIVVSHDRDFAERFGDRIIELKDGKIISDETKVYKEATKISKNVSIINDHAISITDAKKLTKADFDKLYEQIKKSEGKVFISSGENADKSMSIARISDDGASEDFVETKEETPKEYDPKQTKFIKSRMPLNKSIKMGLSGLKTKPVRLIFTMFLSVVSFTMFGVVSSLMLYNPSHSYSDALRDTDYQAEAIEKQVDGIYRNYKLNFDCSEDTEDSYSYSSTQRRKFGVQELKELNNNGYDLKYIGITEMSRTFPFNHISFSKNGDFYLRSYNLRGASDASKEDFEKLGYPIIGNYPTTKNEIMLSKNFGHMLIDGGAVNTKNIEELVGRTYGFRTMTAYDGTPLKISGFFDCGEIPNTYDKLFEENSALSEKEKDKLTTKFNAFWEQSFNSIAFVNSERLEDFAYEEYIDTPYFSRNGLALSEVDLDEAFVVEDDTEIQIRTDGIVKKYPSMFTLYDLDGNKVNNFSLNDDEVYISSPQANDHVTNQKADFYYTMVSEMIGHRYYLNLMPRLSAYLSSSENSQHIQDMLDYYYQNVDALEEFFNTYKDEFYPAYKLCFGATYFSDYAFNSDFGTKYTDHQRELVSSILIESSSLTNEEKTEVKELIAANFDIDLPNFFYYWYLQQLSSYSYAIDNQQIINYMNQLSSTGWKSWTNTDKSFISDYLQSNYEKIMRSGSYLTKFFNGLTYNDYQVIKSDFKIGIPEYIYYKTADGQKGALKVKGYYDATDWLYIVTTSFAQTHSTKNEYSERWISEFKTSYKATEEEKYTYAFVKTDYTFEQVDFMSKKHSTYSYQLTSPRYQEVQTIVYLITLLKNIFLVAGIIFGVFAALMLLNFITISISSKKKDIGILRAIGARKTDVFKIFFSESLFIASLCAILSLILSVVIEFFLNSYFKSQIAVVLLSFGITNIALVVGIALVISFIATIIPVAHSSRKPPVEAIRSL